MRVSHLHSNAGELYGDKQYFPLPYNNYLPAGQNNGYMESLMLWPHSNRNINYYCEVEKTGIYNLSFYFKAGGSFLKDTEKREISELFSMPPSATLHGQWVGTHTFVSIPFSAPAQNEILQNPINKSN